MRTNYPEDFRHPEPASVDYEQLLHDRAESEAYQAEQEQVPVSDELVEAAIKAVHRFSNEHGIDFGHGYDVSIAEFAVEFARTVVASKAYDAGVTVGAERIETLEKNLLDARLLVAYEAGEYSEGQMVTLLNVPSRLEVRECLASHIAAIKAEVQQGVREAKCLI